MRDLASVVERLVAYDAQYGKDAGTGIDEKLFLLATVFMVEPRSILEIGVSAGHATLWLAAAARLAGARMVSVDDWSAAHGGRAKGPEKAAKRLEDNGLAGAVEFVGSDSVTYLRSCADKEFDLVWVDGDHSLEGASADIKEALRVAGKLVIVHDTNQKAYSTVREACLSVCERGCFFDSLRGMFLVTPGEEVRG